MARIDRYSYQELKEAAINSDFAKEDRMNLYNWFELYGWSFWNGEYFDADEYKLYPIYKHDEEIDQYEIIDVEVR